MYEPVDIYEKCVRTRDTFLSKETQTFKTNVTKLSMCNYIS